MVDGKSGDGAAARRSSGRHARLQIGLSFGLGWLFLAIGLVLCLSAAASYRRTRSFLGSAIHQNVPVVGFSTYPPNKSRSHVAYSPTVIIAAQGMPPVQVGVGGIEYPNPYKIGDMVEVLYPPGDPSDAVLNEYGQIWSATQGFCYFSVLFLAIGIFVSVWMRRLNVAAVA